MTAKERSTTPVSSFQVRFSPNVIRAERRRGFLSGLGVFLLSAVPFVEASIAIRQHERVNLGTASNYFLVPPWVAILLGVFMALVGCLVMYLSVRRGPTQSTRQPDEI
jgi:hypothetical protein